MPNTLASLRKSKGLSQEELGKAIARRLSQAIGARYAQKKIARFEAQLASPTRDELQAIAEELEVDIDFLRAIVPTRGPQDADSTIRELQPPPGGRSLLASCVMSKPRGKALDASLSAMKKAIEENGLAVAVFIPYSEIVNLPENSDHSYHLVGEYAEVRKYILAANLAFKNSLSPERAKAVALYCPKAAANVLLPPVLRQFSLNIQVHPLGDVVTKTLTVWTPRTDVDEAHTVRATGVYTLEQQIDAWESYFGAIPEHWLEHNEFLPMDSYWKKIR